VVEYFGVRRRRKFGGRIFGSRRRDFGGRIF